MFKKIKKSTIIKIAIVIVASIIITIIYGPVSTEYFHDFTNPDKIYVSPYEDPSNKEYVEKLNNLNTTTTLSESLKHDMDYLVLNGGGNTIVGSTRVFKMNKEDFQNITFNDYITWTTENFAVNDCKTKEELDKNIMCGIKGYIVFEDNSAIKYLDGKSELSSVNSIDFKYLNGFEQKVVQERRSRQDIEKPSFFYLDKELYKDYSVIDSYTMDTEKEFEDFKNKILEK